MDENLPLAEIIVVTNSMRYTSSFEPIQTLIDCIGARYILVDFNRLISLGWKTDDQKILALLKPILYSVNAAENGFFLCSTEQNTTIPPQLIVSGVNLGCAQEVSNLNEAGLLEGIFQYHYCPSCFGGPIYLKDDVDGGMALPSSEEPLPDHKLVYACVECQTELRHVAPPEMNLSLMQRGFMVDETSAATGNREKTFQSVLKYIEERPVKA